MHPTEMLSCLLLYLETVFIVYILFCKLCVAFPHQLFNTFPSVVPFVEEPVASKQQVNATGSDSKSKPYLPIVMNIINQTVLLF